MAHCAYDHSYRDIFSHPEVVQDLIKAFIQADWIERLDFSTLEPVKDTYVSDSSHVRAQDSIWRLKFNQSEWLYLYIFLEFQSTIDRFMAVRFFTYMGMLFENLIKSKQLISNHLPPVLPFVIYMGAASWNAPRHSSDLFVRNLPQLLKKHQPKFEYHLLDIGHCVLDQSLRESDNLIVPLIQFEQSIQRREQVLSILEIINKKFASKEFDSYRRAMYIYMCRMVNLGKIEPVDLTNLEKTTMSSLVQERMKIYDKSLVEEGLQKGLQKGLLKGRKEGQAEGRLLAIRELAQKMLVSGLSISQVTKISGLDESELKHLLKN